MYARSSHVSSSACSFFSGSHLLHSLPSVCPAAAPNLLSNLTVPKMVLAEETAKSASITPSLTSTGGLRGKLNKVVLAYSGGLDTSVIVPWLRENYGCEVICFTADVGQGSGETDGLEAKAKASGASQLFIKDLKEEFVRDYVFPCLRAGAVYERKYLLGTSMARPVIAKVN
ncbi:hypothetical protein L7F22_055908 [Adiantum nelumboides]|nr:hypothetical protein [Adiantum nelumboides]